MALGKVQEIQHAIGSLTQGELGELYRWLDRNCPQPLDSRIASDLMEGRLDKAIHSAVAEEMSGQVFPL